MLMTSTSIRKLLGPFSPGRELDDSQIEQVAAFLELLHGLPKDMVQKLEQEESQPLPAAK